MLSELTTPNAESQQALMHEPIPCRAARAAVAAQEPEPNRCSPERLKALQAWLGLSLWLPTPVPAAVLPPPDIHPCPLLVLLMLLGANIELIASGNPGISDPLFWASWVCEASFWDEMGTEPLRSA